MWSRWWVVDGNPVDIDIDVDIASTVLAFTSAEATLSESIARQLSLIELVAVDLIGLKVVV